MKKKLRTIFSVFGLSLFAFVQLYPLYWLFMYSLKTNGEIVLSKNILGVPPGPVWGPGWVWEHYTFVLTRSMIPRYMLNSVIYTGATLILVGLLSAFASYAISRMKWKLSGVAYMVFAIGIMIPLHAALLPLLQVLSTTGIKGLPYIGLIVIYSAYGIPMSMMILTSFFKTIPRELEEAAVIDGCGIFGAFWRIMLPLVVPALATASIFTMMRTWNDLLLVNTFVEIDKYKTITVGILNFRSTHTVKMGLIGAGMVIATIPVVILYIIFSERIQRSLVEGAIKG